MFRGIFGGVISALLLGVVACSDDTSSDSFTASPVYGESCSSRAALRASLQAA